MERSPNHPDGPTERPQGVHEIFRFHRGEEMRVYEFRVTGRVTELWRVTECADAPASAIKEEDFTEIDVAVAFLAEVERALVAGGWRKEA